MKRGQKVTLKEGIAKVLTKNSSQESITELQIWKGSEKMDPPAGFITRTSKKTVFFCFYLNFKKMMLFILFAIGWPQIVLIVAIVLILFGGKKLPELMRGLGRGMKEFKDATKEIDNDNEKEK